MKVTVFKNVKDPENGRIVDLSKVIDQIRTGGKLRSELEELRTSENYKSDKMKLPVICFNGEFTRRNIKGLNSHNGFMILDIDGLEDPFKRKEELSEHPNIYAVFISPSYKGVKALLRIPKLKNDSEFKEVFRAAQDEFKDIDGSGKDISRCCFFSYDPDIYVNEIATEFKGRKKIETYSSGDYSGQNFYLKRVTDIVSNSVEGERHNDLLKASRLAGGYIATQKLDEGEAKQALLMAFGNHDREYSPEKTIKDGFKYGLLEPIFETERIINKPQPRLIKPEEPKDYGNYYVPFEEFDTQADHLYNNGRQKGYDTSFECGRDFISYKKKFTTYIYSAPHSGKTQFALEEMVYLADMFGWKFGVYSKEIGEPQDIFAEVASVFIGALFIHDDKNLVMTEEERLQAKEFFKRHFYVIDPLYKGNNLGVTVQDVIDTAAHIEETEGIKIDSLYIDPLSEIEDDLSEYGGREDKQLKAIFSMINNDARANERHNFIVTHIRDQRPIVDKETNLTYFPVPTPREMAGGQMPYRKGYQMICIYRPPHFLIDNETGMNHYKNETHVYIQKSKPKGVGKLGMFKIYWQWKYNQFTEKPEAKPFSPVKSENQLIDGYNGEYTDEQPF